jgi:glycolate oxidase FAD binding subunit
MVHTPQTLADLQQQVRQLHDEATPWLPAGLGSRLDWGPAVAADSAVISGRALAGIREHSADDFTVTVAAGTPLVVLQEALAHHRQWLSVDLPWGDDPLQASTASGSIGGLIARGLSGGYRQRHMGLRDQLLGIQLLRSDGVLARAGGRVVKNVAGYDLMRLLTGSWGSLALITEVTLRTQPIPPQRRCLVIQGSAAALQPLGRWLLGSSLSPERIDLWSAPLAQAAGLGQQPLLLLGLASIDATTLDEQIACVAAKARELAPTPGQAPLVHTPDADAAAALLASARGTGHADWLLRLAVPPSQLWTLLESPELQGLPVTMATGSGIGDGWASAAALPRYRVEALRRRCQQLGGYLTVLRQPTPPPGTQALPAWLDAPSRPLIEAVKRHFDPKQQLARGRLPGVASPLG